MFLFIIVFYRNQKSDSGRTGPLDLVIKKFPLGARSSEKGITHLGVPIVVASERASENTLLRCAGPAIRDASTKRFARRAVRRVWRVAGVVEVHSTPHQDVSVRHDLHRHPTHAEEDYSA